MKKKSFMPYICALCLFTTAVGFMVYSGIKEGSVYFLNVSEALAAPNENSSIRLFGTVGDFTKSEAGNSVEFILVDAEQFDKIINVSFTGIIPDTFEHNVEVILEGSMISGTEFHAKTLMTKCPSKYEKENRV